MGLAVVAEPRRRTRARLSRGFELRCNFVPKNYRAQPLSLAAPPTCAIGPSFLGRIPWARSVSSAPPAGAKWMQMMIRRVLAAFVASNSAVPIAWRSTSCRR